MKGAESRHRNLIKANRHLRCTVEKADKVSQPEMQLQAWPPHVPPQYAALRCLHATGDRTATAALEEDSSHLGAHNNQPAPTTWPLCISCCCCTSCPCAVLMHGLLCLPISPSEQILCLIFFFIFYSFFRSSRKTEVPAPGDWL